MQKKSNNNSLLLAAGAGILGAAVGFLAGAFSKTDENQQQESKQKSYNTCDIETIFCPISGEIMKDPQVLNCGHSFDKQGLKDWLNKENTCPSCRKQVTNISPNFQLKQVIEQIKIEQ